MKRYRPLKDILLSWNFNLLTESSEGSIPILKGQKESNAYELSRTFSRPPRDAFLMESLFERSESKVHSL